MSQPVIIIRGLCDPSEVSLEVYDSGLRKCSTHTLKGVLRDLRFAAGVVTNILCDRAPLSQRPSAAQPRAKGPSARAGASAKRRGPGPSPSR